MVRAVGLGAAARRGCEDARVRGLEQGRQGRQGAPLDDRLGVCLGCGSVLAGCDL